MSTKINKSKKSLITLLTEFFLSKGYRQEDLHIKDGHKTNIYENITTILGSYELAFYFSPDLPRESDRLEVNAYLVNAGSFPTLLSRQPTDDFNLELVFQGLKREIENKMKGTLSLYISTTLELEWLRNEAHQLLDFTTSCFNLNKKG